MPTVVRLRPRDRAIPQRIAHWLATRGASPNGISVFGMVSGVLAGLSLAATQIPSLTTGGFLLTAAFVQLRLLGQSVRRNGGCRAEPPVSARRDVQRSAGPSLGCGNPHRSGILVGRLRCLGVHRGSAGRICRLRPRAGKSRRGSDGLLRTDGEATSDGVCHNCLLDRGSVDCRWT